MNFDQESKSEEIFFCVCVCVWGGGGGGGGGFKPKKKTIGIRLFFCAHSLYKISSSWLNWFSSFNTNKSSNGQVRGIILPMFYGIQSKVMLTWILNED